VCRKNKAAVDILPPHPAEGNNTRIAAGAAEKERGSYDRRDEENGFLRYSLNNGFYRLSKPAGHNENIRRFRRNGL
jgi:hypothetical protein